jgi:hypothetical protein
MGSYRGSNTASGRTVRQILSSPQKIEPGSPGYPEISRIYGDSFGGETKKDSLAPNEVDPTKVTASPWNKDGYDI